MKPTDLTEVRGPVCKCPTVFKGYIREDSQLNVTAQSDQCTAIDTHVMRTGQLFILMLNNDLTSTSLFKQGNKSNYIEIGVRRNGMVTL